MKRFLLFLLAFTFIFASCAETELYNEEPVALDDDSPQISIQEEEPIVAKNETFIVGFCKSESADPYTTSNKLNSELMGLITEPLFSVSDVFEVAPVLCSDYTVREKEWTFSIRNDVTFSDGSKLTVADVEESILAAMEPASYFGTRLSIIESVTSSKRAGTVTITLKYENARFASLLDFPIIKKGTRGNPLPTGTGIYAPDEAMENLVARDGHHSGNTPHYKTIRLCNISTNEELIFKFDALDISTLTSDPTGTASRFPGIPVDLISVPSTTLHYLGFNAKNEKLANKEVRKAIARAIDRKSIAENDFAFMGNEATLPLHPQSLGYPWETAMDLEYDRDAKIEVGIPLTILVNNENSAKVAACNRIAEDLTKCGTTTTVRALPFNEYTTALQNGDFTLYYAEVSLTPDFDITRELLGSLNFGKVSDISMTAALMAYLGGDEGCETYFSTFCDVVPFAPIFFKNTAMYTQKNFFKTTCPSSQNIYYNFCDWEIGG
ncbi:MAG: ABC transporter substrate-binding protein [Oscillospiraceae bacterium]|nr:ABC transporter substrate-binding protein [Oscillospiraceae bacterium]